MRVIVTPTGDQRERRTFIKAVLRISLNEFANTVATCWGVGMMSAVPWVVCGMWPSSPASQSAPTPHPLTLLLVGAQRATDLVRSDRLSPSVLPSLRYTM